MSEQRVNCVQYRMYRLAIIESFYLDENGGEIIRKEFTACIISVLLKLKVLISKDIYAVVIMFIDPAQL